MTREELNALISSNNIKNKKLYYVDEELKLFIGIKMNQVLEVKKNENSSYVHIGQNPPSYITTGTLWIKT